MKTCISALTLVSGLMLVLHGDAAPGDVDLTFDPGSGLNGPTYAIAVQPDGKIIIGGNFTTVAGSVRHRIARLNPDGAGDAGFNTGTGADDLVEAIVVQPDGKVIIGGWFTNIDGTSRNGIARLNADGSLDTSFDPGTGADDLVFSVALQPDGKVLIAGYFTHVNGASRNHIARLNADGSVDAGFNLGAGANDDIYAIVLQPDGKMIIGGLFTAFNGVTINRIARLNPDGSLDSTFNPGTGVSYFGVTALALQPDGGVLLGGIFNTVNGTSRRCIARLNSDGSLDESFNPGTGASGQVGSIALQPDGKVLVGGQFLHFNGTSRGYVARLNADGSLDTTFDPALTVYPPGVACVAIQQDGKILVGGAGLHAIGDKMRFSLVRLNSDGSADFSFNSGTGIGGFNVSSMVAQSDGKMIIGGYFTDINGVSRPSIARLDEHGQLDVSFDPGSITGTSVIFNPPVPVIYSMVLQPDGKIVIGGGFTNINGYERNCVARLNGDGSLDTSFDPGPVLAYNVYSVVLQPDGKILLPGGYADVNGIARLNPDGSLDDDFRPNVGYAFDAAVQSDGKILIAGYTSVNHTIGYYVARLNGDGSLDLSFDPGTGPNNFVFSIGLQPDGKSLLAGSFTTFNGISCNGIARLNVDGSVDASFEPGTGTNTYGGPFLVQPDGKIFVGRAFTNSDGTIRGGIARLNPNGSLDNSFKPGTGDERGAGVMSIALLPDSRIVISGGFSSFNDVPRACVARLLGDAPVIITQPASRTNVVGTTATFTVVALGPEPLSYQWYKDGVALSDRGRISGSTTPTLTVKGVHFRDAGSYTVSVSNSSGSVVSDPALLRVRLPAVARIKVHPRTELPSAPHDSR